MGSAGQVLWKRRPEAGLACRKVVNREGWERSPSFTEGAALFLSLPRVISDQKAFGHLEKLSLEEASCRKYPHKVWRAGGLEGLAEGSLRISRNMELLPFPILEGPGKIRGVGNANQSFICSGCIC